MNFNTNMCPPFSYSIFKENLWITTWMYSLLDCNETLYLPLQYAKSARPYLCVSSQHSYFIIWLFQQLWSILTECLELKERVSRSDHRSLSIKYIVEIYLLWMHAQSFVWGEVAYYWGGSPWAYIQGTYHCMGAYLLLLFIFLWGVGGGGGGGGGGGAYQNFTGLQTCYKSFCGYFCLLYIVYNILVHVDANQYWE